MQAPHQDEAIQNGSDVGGHYKPQYHEVHV